MKNTPEQEMAIRDRGHDLLVSAPAGSGKTKVLVSRIVSLITDPEHPADIDRLLVVTFTRAAAAEMRERVASQIEEMAREAQTKLKDQNTAADREKWQWQAANLERQQTLIHNAQITTIDSFCLYIVRNYFQDISLDPGFRIAEEGELKLLEEEVLDQVFEKWYAAEEGEQKQAFLELINAYSGKRDDQRVRDMVHRIYRQSQSNPWPQKWIRGLAQSFDPEEIGKENSTGKKMLQLLAQEGKAVFEDETDRLTQLREQAGQIPGLEKYAQTLEKDLQQLEEFPEETTYASMYEFLKEWKLGSMAAVRGFKGDAKVKDAIREQRAQAKKRLEGLREQFFYASPEELGEQMEKQRGVVEILTAVAADYFSEMASAKEKRHIVDFADIEHFALQILVNENTGEPGPAALELREHLQAIMIDEYQDSNQVQEEIMKAISGGRGSSRLFMVGDVKQSIYRFRLARPEIFMEKYNRYQTDAEGPERKIILSKNFRSRPQVLDLTNDIFEKIMQEDFGGIRYDEEARLYQGRDDFPEAEGMKGELLILDPMQELEEGSKNTNQWQEEAASSGKIEARMVGQRIRELIGQRFQVIDETGEEASGMRPVRYSDMVILLRGLRGWAQDFAGVLEEMGIPVQVESSTGYFTATEVQVLLSFLQILDNPFQDIPMAAVLKSPIGGFSDEELAEIRIGCRDCSFSQGVWELMQEESEREMEDGQLLERLKNFGKQYKKLRDQVRDVPIHRLIQLIVKETGYGNYVAAMPAGRRRIGNLDMLVQKAIAYEKTSYKGLFHFVRYIEMLKNYEVDYGEASTTGENENVVRIMTIHKSKGLEFPVVFVSGCGRKFNEMELRERMLLHPDYGIGLQQISGNPRIRSKTLHHTVIADAIKKENLCEEMRVLYVAMTRAKEKLILTGSLPQYGEKISKYTAQTKAGKPLSYTERSTAACYLDWILPAVMSYPDRYDWKVLGPEDLMAEELKRLAKNRLKREEVEERIRRAPDRNPEFERAFSERYRYQDQLGKKSKYSVSELKKASMLERYDRQQTAEQPPAEKVQRIPSFISGEEGAYSDLPEAAPGALRGTAVHRFMECLEFEKIPDPGQADEAEKFTRMQLRRMQTDGELTGEMAELISPAQIRRFVQNPIAIRMREAQKEGRLYREQPFVMEYDEVLLQGIVDVFWLEKDRIWVLDYKTDRVKKEEELRERYQKQLALYAQALCRYFDKKEENAMKLLYSFQLGKVVEV